MSQPPPFGRSFSFTNFQASNPTTPPPGSALDGEFNNAKATLDGIANNLAQIQRDDGALKNGSVTFDTLSASLQTAGLAPALPWVTATAYSVGASATQGSAFYRCLVTHTSGTFATDLAAGRWVLILDFSTIALVAAAMIGVTPSGSLTSNVQTSLQALDAGKAATSHTHPSSAISDSTAAGRALLTAADANAQNVLLGTTSLGFQSGDVKETATLVLQSGWYYCDGSAKNRVTDVNLFNAITIQQSGVLTSASAVVTGLSDTSNMSPLVPISGTGVPVGTFIQSVDSGTQITMTQNATSSATTPLVFAPYGVGDGSTTFNLPNRTYLGVGRDNASGSATNVTQVSTTISLTSASASATVGSATGLAPGMFVNHPKAPVGTQILTISGTTLTLSQNATGTVVGSAARFSFLGDAQTLGRVGGALSVSTTLVAANLPPITSVNASQAITVATSAGQQFPITPNSISSLSAASGGGGVTPQSGSTWSGVTSLSGNNSISVTSSGTTSTPIIKSVVQPTIVMNYVIKR